MSFEEYFQLEGQPEEEQLLRFLLGLSPSMLQLSYLVYPLSVDLASHKGPSTPMACEICAGIAATECLKILLRRGKSVVAPCGLHFDPYRNRFTKTWRPGGNRNPIQRIALRIARRRFTERQTPIESPATCSDSLSIEEKILDIARWAPSGDNTQPWRFEIKGEGRAVVHGFDTREHCVYDLNGRASQLALGALIETITIAAADYGYRTEVSRRVSESETRPTFDLKWTPDSSSNSNGLSPYIQVRATQRRPMRMRALTPSQKKALENAVRPAGSIFWIEGFSKRFQMAKLLFLNAGLRLTLPEAFELHRNIIEWDARFSVDRIPDKAVGFDPITSRITRWAFADWERVNFLNTYLGGTLAPRLQLDLIPGMACAAHFVILAPEPPQTVDDFVAAGRDVQRIWLTASKYGLWQQPELTPLIFISYARSRVTFSDNPALQQKAERIASRFEALTSPEVLKRAVWMGRLGSGPPPSSRSLRLPLKRLMVT